MYSKNARNFFIIFIILVIAIIVYFFAFKKSAITLVKNLPRQIQPPTTTAIPVFPKKIILNGRVIHGQHFEKEIGNNLFFRLEPFDLGWTISVGSKTSKTSAKDVGYESYNNFAAMVTPPYRGVNNIYIEGWHFRNSGNTGPNLADEKNVNAPQEVREFDFVLNDADYEKSFDTLQKIMWSSSYSEQEVNAAFATHEALIKGHGKLTIQDLKLNNLVAGKQAGIESMKFDVEFSFP